MRSGTEKLSQDFPSPFNFLFPSWQGLWHIIHKFSTNVDKIVRFLSQGEIDKRRLFGENKDDTIKVPKEKKT